jgi:hypothetical protein
MAKMLPRLINRTLALAGGALAVFHGWLFASQAAAGRLEDPWVIFRWMAAAALILALVAVHQRGTPVWGRKGIAIWLLAALLHGPAIADNESFKTFALPEAAAASVLQLVSSAGVALTLWMLATLLAARRTTARPLRALVPIIAGTARFAAGHASRFAPRPPPLRC